MPDTMSQASRANEPAPVGGPRDYAVAVVTVLSSTSTLFCCALPALFVALGAGATFAGLISTVPQLIWLSENKAIVFGFGGAMLLVSAAMQVRAARAPCPVDPVLAQACTRTRRVSTAIFLISIMLYTVGSFFAFAAPVLWE